MTVPRGVVVIVIFVSWLSLHTNDVCSFTFHHHVTALWQVRGGCRSWRQQRLLHRPRHYHHATTSTTDNNTGSDDNAAAGDSSSSSSTTTTTTTASADDVVVWNELSSMTTRQLKAELKSLMISTHDVFEKEQLIQRLYQARMSSSTKSTTTTTTLIDNNNNNNVEQQTLESNQMIVVTAPLFLTSGRNAADRRLATESGDELVLKTKELQFATIQMDVLSSSSSSSSFPLTLLLDTACSGFVLRPSVAAAHNLPLLSTPVTMTGAGGVAETTGLALITSFRIGNGTFDRPLPAALQNIATLPPQLDGILGLSFLSQFDIVEWDFRQGMLRLYKMEEETRARARDILKSLPVPPGLEVVAEADMMILGKTGIYAVHVRFGGGANTTTTTTSGSSSSRGPVKMIVDTGAAATVLNWKGVSDLSVTVDSPQVRALKKTESPSAVMGSDNIAMPLTHRICVSSSYHLGRAASVPSLSRGVSLQDSQRRLCMDIGDIAILNMFKDDDIGGILGIDALARCAMVRMTFGSGGTRSNKNRIILYN